MATLYGRDINLNGGTDLLGRNISDLFGTPSATAAPNFPAEQSNVSKIASLQSPAALPPWLTTDPSSLMPEMTKLYGSVPGMMSPAALAKAFDTSINTTRSEGGQIADNASREAVTRAGISGGQINSGMVKSQAMLPVYDATNKLATDKEGAVLAAKQQQVSAMGQLATMMSQLRSSYLTKLGELQISKQGQDNNWVLSQQQLRLDQANKDREFNLANMSRVTGTATGGVSPATNRGYIPDQGPLMGASSGGQLFPSPTFSADGKPIAIQGTGTASFGGGGKELAPKPGQPMTIQDWLKILMASQGGTAATSPAGSAYAGADLTDQRAVA